MFSLRTPPGPDGSNGSLPVHVAVPWHFFADIQSVPPIKSACIVRTNAANSSADTAPSRQAIVAVIRPPKSDTKMPSPGGALTPGIVNTFSTVAPANSFRPGRKEPV